MKNILFVALLCRALISFGQAVDTRINPELLNRFWSAHWISPPKGNLNSYGVYHFRKTISLDKKPDHFKGRSDTSSKNNWSIYLVWKTSLLKRRVSKVYYLKKNR